MEGMWSYFLPAIINGKRMGEQRVDWQDNPR
jgi:hypothetical protein